MSTSAQRDEDRLTDTDRATIRERLTETWHSWNEHRATPSEVRVAEMLTLERLAAHSIGCTTDDLRGSERMWIRDEIGHLID